MNKAFTNALLKDGKIMFWWTGKSRCTMPEDFYKDFYYAGMNMVSELQTGRYELVTGEIEYLNNEEWVKASQQFYKQFALHEDFKGAKPY